MHSDRPSRRDLVSVAAGLAVTSAAARAAAGGAAGGKPVMVGSENALPGMRAQFPKLLEGGAPLDAAIEVCKVAEADAEDTSVGLGGLPNEDGVVQLDAACMDGRTHNSGAVAAIEDILHPIEVARLVMERTDHCQIFGAGAYYMLKLIAAGPDLTTPWEAPTPRPGRADQRPKRPLSALDESPGRTQSAEPAR